jgi:hypothetical protein
MAETQMLKLRAFDAAMATEKLQRQKSAGTDTNSNRINSNRR